MVIIDSNRLIISLYNYLIKTTFIVDPATCSYHHCYKGGMLKHCDEVYENLINLCNKNKLNYPKWVLWIIAYCHDLDRVGSFSYDLHNKTYISNISNYIVYHGMRSWNKFNNILKYNIKINLNNYFNEIRYCIIGHQGFGDISMDAKNFYNEHQNKCKLLNLTNMANKLSIANGFN